MPTETAASSDVLASSPPASLGFAPAKALVSVRLSADAVTVTAPVLPPKRSALLARMAWVFSAMMILSAIPAPIPTPPSPSLLSASALVALSWSSSISSLTSSRERSPSALNIFMFLMAFSSLSIPPQRPLISPTSALALLSYLLFETAAIVTSPDDRISAPELITAWVLFLTTTFRPTAPASENSPVLAPATASA